MIRKLGKLDYMTDKELIEKVMLLMENKVDKLDNVSKVSLLVSRPLVYLATLEDQPSAALLENILTANGSEEEHQIRTRVTSLIDIMRDTEVNDVLIKNIVKACENPVDIAEAIYHMDCDVEATLKDNFLAELEKILPPNFYKAIKEELKSIEDELEAIDTDDEE